MDLEITELMEMAKSARKREVSQVQKSIAAPTKRVQSFEDAVGEMVKSTTFKKGWQNDKKRRDCMSKRWHSMALS